MNKAFNFISFTGFNNVLCGQNIGEVEFFPTAKRRGKGRAVNNVIGLREQLINKSSISQVTWIKIDPKFFKLISIGSFSSGRNN